MKISLVPRHDPLAPALLSDWSAHSQPALAKPDYAWPSGVYAIDPVFATRIYRVSGDVGTPVGTLGFNWPSRVGPHYPKDPAWNADQTLLVLKQMSGVPAAGAMLFVDGETYEPLFSRSNAGGAPSAEWTWHPSMPDYGVYVSESTGELGIWNVRTNVRTTKLTAPAGYSNFSFGSNEGMLSLTGRYLAVMAQRNSDSHWVGYRVDLGDPPHSGAASKGPDCDMSWDTDLDWVAVSPLGGYLIGKSQASGMATRVFDPTTGAEVANCGTSNTFGHCDFALNAVGEEIIFTALAGGTNIRWYASRRLPDGALVTLSPNEVMSFSATSWHQSCRNVGPLAGPSGGPWGMGVSNTVPGSGNPLDGDIHLIRLATPVEVRRICHHRAIEGSNDYPRATISPDGKRVVFMSNWGNAAGPNQAYVVDYRENWR